MSKSLGRYLIRTVLGYTALVLLVLSRSAPCFCSSASRTTSVPAATP